MAHFLIARAIDVLRTLHCEMIWCDARVTATGFYQRNGFRFEGEMFVKDGLE